MVNIINQIAGRIVLFTALIRTSTSPSFKVKLIKIKNEIEMSNSMVVDFPSRLTSPLVEIEDKRFFFHKGIDFYSIMRAILKSITSTRLEGASTIGQQLIRSITNERDLKLKRKINEIMLSVLIDNSFSKAEILKAYVNLYMFNSSIGIYNLCNKEKYDTFNLTKQDCAELAARFKYPHLNKNNYVRFLKRVRTIEKKTMLSV